MDHYTVSPQALFQPLAQESVLLDLGTERYFSLDDVGTRIWTLIAEHGTIDVVVAQMLSEYDVEEAVLRRDIEALLGRLVEAGLLLRGEAASAA
jgi:Coenzyme PQQ synthesis protein D (PqqD)